MSLYDEALLAGSVAPGQDIPPELLQQILAGREVGGLALGRGNYIGPQPTESSDPTGNRANFENPIYGADPRTSGTTARWHTWNRDGTYRGYGSGPGPTIDSLVMAATAAGLGGAAAGWGSTGTSGMSAADMAAMDQAMIDMGAGATNVGTGSMSGLEGLAPTVTDGAASQTIEVIGQRLPQATLGAEELALGTPALEELGTIPQSEPLDPTNYSNEGRNYPTPDSTQGPGGSPINASQFPPTPINDVNGNPVVPPVTNNEVTPPPVTPPPIDPSKISDWTSLFNVLSGLYGMKLAGDAAEKSDPFGPYRKGYADRLQALEANPGLLKSTPGYLGGLDAIQRQMAAKGYLGSGNMAGALMRYSGDSYHNEANRLATLAGANIGPGQTYFNQAQLTRQALSNIGYGLTPYMQGGPR